MADAGDSKSPAPRGHEGSTPSSGTSKPSLEAIDFTHEFLPSDSHTCWRRRGEPRGSARGLPSLQSRADRRSPREASGRQGAGKRPRRQIRAARRPHVDLAKRARGDDSLLRHQQAFSRSDRFHSRVSALCAATTPPPASASFARSSCGFPSLRSRLLGRLPQEEREPEWRGARRSAGMNRFLFVPKHPADRTTPREEAIC
jgi:hypothetical protein